MNKLDLHFDSLFCSELSIFARLRIRKIQRYIHKLEVQHSKEIAALKARLEDCDCGPQPSPFFQPCCGITWEEEQHKETCKYYCKTCGGHNEYCDCEEEA